MVLNFLDAARNNTGPLSDDLRGRVLKFMVDPNVQSWDSISGIIVVWKPNKTYSIWEAVKRIRPDLFEKLWIDEGPGSTPETRWRDFPNPFIVARAIRTATSTTKLIGLGRLYIFPA